ncbi:MAG: hypothetical protein AAF677_11175 [Pseudomonadota bacterium]
MALAACLALTVGLGTGAMLSGPGLGPAVLPGVLPGLGGMADDGTRLVLGPHGTIDPLGAALERLPSGEVGEGIRPVFTFRDEAGRPCREFETAEAETAASGTGIACRDAGGDWQVLILVATSADGTEGGDVADDDGFRAASGAAADALGATLDAIGAGPVLPAEEEALLIDRGWAAGN